MEMHTEIQSNCLANAQSIAVYILLKWQSTFPKIILNESLNCGTRNLNSISIPQFKEFK